MKTSQHYWKATGHPRELMRPAILVLSLAVALSEETHAQCHQWSRQFVNNFVGHWVRALAVHDFGAGVELYAGGEFLGAGGVTANHIAKWNGSQWAGLGPGLNDCVYTICSFDSGTGPNLYVGGIFTGTQSTPPVVTGNLARWNGNAWSIVGSGMGAPVYCLAVFDDGSGPGLFIGGQFFGSPNSPNIIKWNGSAYSAVGSGTPGTNGTVLDLAVFDDGTGPALYVRGTFTQAGGNPANGLARWDGAFWSALPPGGPPAGGKGLATFDDGSGPALYAANLNIVYRWDGQTWSALPPLGTFSVVEEIGSFNDVSGSKLIVGGRVSVPGQPGSLGVVQWNGTDWGGLGAGVSNSSSPDTSAFATYDHDQDGVTDLYVGGHFTEAAGLSSRNVACWLGCRLPIDSFCPGDGALFPCPCVNQGQIGRGCAWHNNPAGALLAATGAPDPDTLVLSAYDMPPNGPSTIFLKGDQHLDYPAMFGDGLRCIDGNLIRLGTKTNVGGAAQFPEPGDALVSARGQTPPGSGMIAYYQTWYRNAAVFCTSATYNATNGVRVVW